MNNCENKIQCEICGEWAKKTDVVDGCCKRCYRSCVKGYEDEHDYDEEVSMIYANDDDEIDEDIDYEEEDD